MNLKLHHVAKERATLADRRRTGKHTHTSRRHHLVPVGNRTEALQQLEDLFGVNDGGLLPNLAVY